MGFSFNPYPDLLSSSEGFLGKVFGWDGFGFFGVFILQTLKLGGLKVPSTFGI
jgi:hypothetical protein